MTKEQILKKIKSIEGKKELAYECIKKHPCKGHIKRVMRDYDILVTELRKGLE